MRDFVVCDEVSLIKYKNIKDQHLIYNFSYSEFSLIYY